MNHLQKEKKTYSAEYESGVDTDIHHHLKRESHTRLFLIEINETTNRKIIT